MQQVLQIQHLKRQSNNNKVTIVCRPEYRPKQKTVKREYMRSLCEWWEGKEQPTEC